MFKDFNLVITLSSLTLSERKQNLLAAFLLSFIFTSPFLLPALTRGEQNFLILDQLILTFPQFVYGAHLFKEGIFSGVDFLTSAGGSDFFLRANLPGRYPLFDLLYAVNTIIPIRNWEAVYVFLLFVHLFIGSYFIIKLGREYFKLSLALSIFWSVLSTYSAIRFLYTPFLFITALYPCIIYILTHNLVNEYRATFSKMILQSLPFVLVFLSGYIPLSVASTICALIGAFLIYLERNDNKIDVIRLLKSWLPLIIASLIVLPFYLSIVIYYNENYAGPKSLFFSAHQLVGYPSDFFSLITNSLPIPRSESGSISLGLMSLLLLLLATFAKGTSQNSPYKSNYFIWFGVFVISFIWVANLGKVTALSDFFYYLVPSLGKMHIYSRFLPFALLPFSLLIVKSLVLVYDGVSKAIIKTFLILILLLVLTLSIVLSLGYLAGQPINFQKLLVELIAVSILLYAIHSNKYKTAIMIATLTSFSFAANYVYLYTNASTDFSWQTNKAKQIYFNPTENDNLINYIKENSGDKILVKYLDLNSEPTTHGVMRNYPWLVSDKIKLSNYLGYELHVGRYREINRLMPFYGLQNLGYVIRSGVDFIVVDKEIASKFPTVLENFIDPNVPPYYLGHGRFLRKTKNNIEYGENYYTVSFMAWSNNEGSIVNIDNEFGNVQEIELGFERKVYFINVNKDQLSDIRLTFIKEDDSDLYIQNFGITKYENAHQSYGVPLPKINYTKGFTEGVFSAGGLYTMMTDRKGVLDFSLGTIDNPNPKRNFDFNNGVISIDYLKETGDVNDFHTNYFGDVAFSVNSKNGAYVQLNLFYSDRYSLLVNGMIKQPKIVDGLGGIFLEPGKQDVQIVYKNNLHTFFNNLYFSYLILVLCVFLFKIVHFAWSKAGFKQSIKYRKEI